MGSTTSLELSRQYTSFAGTDIRVVVGGENLGSVQGVSYAVQREKAPIYVMGRVDPLSFSRGKRGIAGTIITLMLDTHILVDPASPFKDLSFVSDNDEFSPDPGSLNDASALTDLTDPASVAFTANDLGSNFSVRSAWYVDQLPPFDIVIVAANEYGKAATMRIYGVEILNEGSGFSIDDMVIDNQMTFVCKTILPWQRMGSWNLDVPGSQSFTPV
jgi:hypothetical protein